MVEVSYINQEFEIVAETIYHSAKFVLVTDLLIIPPEHRKSVFNIHKNLKQAKTII